MIGKSEKKVKGEEKKKTVHDVLRLRGGASSESDSSEDNDNIRPTLLDPADTEQLTALLNSVMSFAHSGLSHLSKVAWGHMCNGELRNLTGETSEVRAFDTLRQIAGTIQLLENFRSHHRDIGFSLGNKLFIDLLAGLLDLHRLLVAHHQLRQCEISEREKVETPEFNSNIVTLIGCCDNFLMKHKIFKETSLLTPSTSGFLSANGSVTNPDGSETDNIFLVLGPSESLDLGLLRSLNVHGVRSEVSLNILFFMRKL